MTARLITTIYREIFPTILKDLIYWIPKEDLGSIAFDILFIFNIKVLDLISQMK